MMCKELKAEILKWLLEHENEWQRVNACTEAFRQYVYNTDGNFLIGGNIILDFIKEADRLLYGRRF